MQCYVGAGGGLADEQAGGDLVVVETFADQPEDFALAVGEIAQTRVRGLVVLRAADEGLDHPTAEMQPQRALTRWTSAG